MYQDYDYYDRYDDGRDLFDRRYSGMSNSGMRGNFCFTFSINNFQYSHHISFVNCSIGGIPMGRRDPMPMPPTLGGGGLRGLSGSNSMRGSSGYDSMFSRRTPPRSSNGLGRFR